MKEKVIEFAEQGRLSKRLATIMIDCDVKFHAESYELSQPDADKVQEIFDELEFRRLKDQFIKIFPARPKLRWAPRFPIPKRQKDWSLQQKKQLRLDQVNFRFLATTMKLWILKNVTPVKPLQIYHIYIKVSRQGWR